MIVVATAGHVDHGKSTLLRALTGIDPDRWAEEKRRGLTIDLGFAWATTPRGRELGFVDVPGHERFLPNMLAGVGRVPAALLVIDANEGWRAQTIEHVAILDLLEVRACVVALTKIDRAEPDAIAAVREETVARLATSSLAGAPIVEVAAEAGTGIDQLWTALDAMLDTVTVRADGCARLWVDRAFTVPGAGTVVTGTLTDGSLAAGDAVQLAGRRDPIRVRGLHRHGRAADRVDPIARTAINLAGIDPETVPRGTLLAADPALRAATTIDAALRSLGSSEPFTGRGDHRLHVGTAEVRARIQLLEPLAGGASGFARIRFDEPVPLRAGDRFVLRDTGRHRIVAGGRILDPAPAVAVPLRERMPVLERLAAAETPASALLQDRGCIPERELAALAGSDAIAGIGITLDDHVASQPWIEETAQRIRDELTGFHAAHPAADGLEAGVLRAAIAIAERPMRALLARLDDVVDQGTTIRLASFTPAADATRPIRDELAAAGMQPPDRRDLEDRYGREAIASLVRAGAAVSIGDRLLLDADVHAQAVARVLVLLQDAPQATTTLREALGTSRRVALPFLEALDRAGITRFDGTLRRLGPNAPTTAAR